MINKSEKFLKSDIVCFLKTKNFSFNITIDQNMTVDYVFVRSDFYFYTFLLTIPSKSVSFNVFLMLITINF